MRTLHSVSVEYCSHADCAVQCGVSAVGSSIGFRNVHRRRTSKEESHLHGCTGRCGSGTATTATPTAMREPQCRCAGDFSLTLAVLSTFLSPLRRPCSYSLFYVRVLVSSSCVLPRLLPLLQPPSFHATPTITTSSISFSLSSMLLLWLLKTVLLTLSCLLVYLLLRHDYDQYNQHAPAPLSSSVLSVCLLVGLLSVQLVFFSVLRYEHDLLLLLNPPPMPMEMETHVPPFLYQLWRQQQQQQQQAAAAGGG